MKPRFSVRTFLLLCSALALLTVWVVQRWSYESEWSRAGFSHNDKAPAIVELLDQMKNDAANQGFEIIDRPDWADKHQWESADTTWFKLENDSDRVVLCINDFGGYLEGIILGNKKCFPWEDSSIEERNTQAMVDIVRDWWTDTHADYVAKTAE